MAAPSSTVWGSVVGNYAKLGIYTSVSSSDTSSTVSIEVWFWTKYSCYDSNNTYYFNNNATSATTSKGAVSISHSVASGSGWSTSNQTKIGSYTYTYTRGTSNTTYNCAAKVTGFEADALNTGDVISVTTSYTIPVLSSYTVSFNANGGSGAPSSQTKWHGSTLTLSSTKPTRTGYTFKNWNTKSDGSGTNYSSGGSYTSNSSVTLYAIWTPATYTNSINHWRYVGTGGNNGNGTMYRDSSEDTTFTGTYGSSVTIPSSHVKSYTGYHNSGSAGSSWGGSEWTTKNIGSTFTQPAGGISIEYYYYLNTYTVSFNANGGSGAPSSQTKTYGVTLTLSSTKPTRSNYTFLGWGKTSSDTSASYSAGGSYTSNANITLYAIWRASVSLNYNANGGSGAPSNVNDYIYNATTSKSFTISSTTPTRSGYNFLGWSTSSTATSPDYSPNGSVSVSAGKSVTLYAVWSVSSRSLTVNPNGGTWLGSSVSQTISQNHNTTKTIPACKRTGYTFLGYSRTDDGSNEYTYTSDPTFRQGIQTVNVYNNKFDGTVTHTKMTPDSTSENPMKSSYIYKITSTKEVSPGYGGFYTAISSAANKVFVHTFVAKVPAGCKLAFAMNEYGTDGYSYWLTDNVGTGKYEIYSYLIRCGTYGNFATVGFIYLSSVNSLPVTWYLAYNQISSVENYINNTDPLFNFSNNVKVYNNLSNGNVIHTLGSSSGQHPLGGKILTIKTIGEASPNHGGFQNSIYSSANKTYIHTFTAKIPSGLEMWIGRNAIGDGGKSYWLTDNTGTGDWARYSYIVEAGTSGNFSTFGFVYIANGTVPIEWQLASEEIIDLSSLFLYSGNGTLTAEWMCNSYKIEFNANGGSGSMSNMVCEYDKYYNLSSNTFTKTHYSFNGWESDDGKVYYNSASFKNLSSNRNTVKLYAKWKPVQYGINFNANGGVGAPSKQLYDYGSNTRLTKFRPTRSGYKFIGWSDSSSSTTIVYYPEDLINTTVGKDITLYAVWKIISNSNIYLYDNGKCFSREFVEDDSVYIDSTAMCFNEFIEHEDDTFEMGSSFVANELNEYSAKILTDNSGNMLIDDFGNVFMYLE